MIFRTQREVELTFQRRGLEDIDDYAVRIANVVSRLPPNASATEIGAAIRRQRTGFYRRNRSIDREVIEAQLATRLEAVLQAVERLDGARVEPRDLAGPRKRLRSQRRSTGKLLDEFVRFIQARSIDVFWESRKKRSLVAKPERVAQVLLSAFAAGTIGSSGLVLRELPSGIGFVDVALSFNGGALHLIELKILKARFTGQSQLARYMKTEGRGVGSLVVIDARPPTHKSEIPARIHLPEGRITVYAADINPVPPHKL